MTPNDIAKLIDEDNSDHQIGIIVDYKKKEFYISSDAEAGDGTTMQSINPNYDPHDVRGAYYCPAEYGAYILLGMRKTQGYEGLLYRDMLASYDDALDNYLVLMGNAEYDNDDHDHDDDADDYNLDGIIEHIINHQDGEINRHHFWTLMPKSLRLSNTDTDDLMGWLDERDYPAEVYEFKCTSGNGEIGTTGKIVRVSRKKVIGLMMMLAGE